MSGRRLPKILRHFQQVLAPAAMSEWSDRQLLERFASEHDEMAFAALVRRHSALVLGVGRRILGQEQDAEEVFQATFLILARKAGCGGWQQSIAGWLYRVAYRLAIRTRAKIIRQRVLEKKAGTLCRTKPPAIQDSHELYTVLDEELHRLSDQYREPLFLCYLGAKTRDRAARQLGWSLRTLERRLEQGLKLLRTRLRNRGVELPLALLAAGLSHQAASTNVSAAMVTATVEAAVAFGSSAMTAGGTISTQIVALAEGGLKAMAMTKLKIAILAFMAATLLAAGAGVVGHRLLATEQAKAPQVVAERKATPPAAVVWPEGTIVKGRVVDPRGNAVAQAEVLLLGEERLFVDADRRNWFVLDAPKDQPKPPSTRTDAKGEFRIKRDKGTADRLAVIAEDPLLWVVSRKSLGPGEPVEIKLPPSGSLAITCALPGKAAKQPVEIELRTFDGASWNKNVLRFHESVFAVPNPGERVFDHLPPAQYSVERAEETPTGKNSVLMTSADRHLVKVEPNQRATIHFQRKAGRPLVGQVRGLENVDLRYAHVTIGHWGPEEEPDRNGRRTRYFTAFQVLPITSDGRFTTDPIPPGKYILDLFAVRSATLEQSSQGSDFDGRLQFTVPEKGEISKVEVLAKPSHHQAALPSSDYRLHVVDPAGKPVPIFQAMIHTADAWFTKWYDGRNGLVGFGSMLPDANVWDVLVRADGYVSAVVRLVGEQRNRLQQDNTKITIQRGERVELRFRLPEGLTWPSNLLLQAYFEGYRDRAGLIRQSVNRQQGESTDFNMLNLRPIGPGRFELQLAPDTAPFHVAIHAPGFLQHFESGPFRLADVKDGILEIPVPHPAGLDIHFDPALDNTADASFQGAVLEVWRRIPGTTGSYLTVATKETTAPGEELRLTDLAPGTYRASVRTHPKRDSKSPSDTAINPGAYHDAREFTLEPAQSIPVRFRYQAFDPKAFRGQRTAVLRFRMPDGTKAKGARVKVEYYDGHYGNLVVYSGTIPASGDLTLQGITDRVPLSLSERPYTVTAESEQLGRFGFTSKEPVQGFDFHLAPQVGDLVPDIELRRIADSTSLQLSSLRGQLVYLEFWATSCGPCQPAMAELNRMAADQGAAWKGRVAIIPISIDTNPERVKSHVGQRGWDRLEHYWGGKGTDSDFDAPAARAFLVSGVPQAILIGRDGRILWRGHPLDHTGGQDLKSRIEAALKQ
jgi:RNA polymerase sigma factor (sigma-70 family)